MNIILSQFSTHPIDFLSKTIETFTPLQKRVVVVATLIFAALAVYAITRWCFQTEDTIEDEPVDQRQVLDCSPLMTSKKVKNVFESSPLNETHQPKDETVPTKGVFKMDLVVTEENIRAAKLIQKVFRRHLYIQRNLKMFGQRSFGPREIQELSPKLLEQGAKVEIMTNPLPPLRSNALDEKRAEIWVNLHAEKDRPLAKKFIASIKHYSFEEFENAIRESVEAFNLKIMSLPPEKRDYVLLVGPWDNGGNIKKRSNSWVASIALKYLAHPPVSILKYNEEINHSDYANINRFLFVDDAAYSGAQLCNTIGDLKIDISDNSDTQVHFVVPFLSTYARERIFELINKGKYLGHGMYEPWKAQFIFEKFKLFPTFEYIFNKDERAQLNQMLNTIGPKEDEDRYNQSKSLTYFDHKIPDYYSTFEETMRKGHFLGVDYKVIDPVLKKEGFIAENTITPEQIKAYNARYNDLRHQLCYHPFIPETVPPYKLLNKDDLEEFLTILSKEGFGDGKILTNYQVDRYPPDRYAVVETKNGVFALDKECQIAPQKIEESLF